MNEPFLDPMPPVDGVSHTYVDAGGLRVHLATAGPADGEPVLLLHGWPQHWYEWRGVAPLLAERGYRVLMPDLRGLGWTEVTEGGYEKENLARDQIALLDALGIDQVRLMGHDWGGYAGFLMCLLAPERVTAFVPANIIHPWPKRSLRGVLDSWRLVYQVPMLLPWVGPRATRAPGLIRTMLQRSKPGVFSDLDAEVFEAQYRRPERAYASSRYYRTFHAHDLPLLLRRHWTAYRLSVPTLYLYGTGDLAIRPHHLEGWEAFADDMNVRQIDDTGHFVVDARPEPVAQYALDFFQAR